IKPNKVTIETLPYAPSLSRDTSQLESFNNMEFSRTGSYLPQKISILGDVDSREEGVSLAFYLDTQQLYESAVRLNGAEGGSVNFVVSVDVNNPDESIIKLAGSEKEVLFELWEVD
uniref:hypothetical protein n=1 Tax=Teredinibacter waterburyi TaxID=1500538 RepID=UPI001CAA834C